MVARFFFLTVFIFCNFFCVGECREFIFVASTSQSMQDSDPLNKVDESIAWAIANLNDDDEVGVITFKDTPKIERQLSKVNSASNKIFNFEYSGQSNAGDAILSAVDILTPKFNTERNIIFIGNGEIFLTDATQTLQSAKNFQAALEQASWSNISVYILNLRYSGNPANYHSYSAYAKEIPIPHAELMTTLRTIFHNDFNVPHINLFSDFISGENLSIEIPTTSAENLKLFLISSNPGTATLKDSATISGQFINAFDVKNPATNNFDIAVNYPKNTSLTVDAKIEVSGSLQTELYFDTLKITPVDNNGKNFLADKFFNDKPVRVKINDKIFNSKVSDGSIEIDVSDETEKISLQKVFFSDLGILFFGNDTAEINLSNEYLPYILAGLAILLIIILFLRQKKLANQPKKVEEETQPTLTKKITEPIKKFPKQIVSATEIKKISYNGKLAIYVTKTASEEEISPREFNLFRVNAAEINLHEILQKCNIEEDFAGVENIIITPTNRGIIIANNSDCTIIKRNNLIERGRQTEMYYNDSINIATEDETAELILMYKSLKPN